MRLGDIAKGNQWQIAKVFALLGDTPMYWQSKHYKLIKFICIRKISVHTPEK